MNILQYSLLKSCFMGCQFFLHVSSLSLFVLFDYYYQMVICVLRSAVSLFMSSLFTLCDKFLLHRVWQLFINVRVLQQLQLLVFLKTLVNLTTTSTISASFDKSYHLCFLVFNPMKDADLESVSSKLQPLTFLVSLDLFVCALQCLQAQQTHRHFPCL